MGSVFWFLQRNHTFLAWCSGPAIGSGRTMNREAAPLHLPVYRTLRQKLGAIDQYLAAQKRLVLIQSVAVISARIKLVKRER